MNISRNLAVAMVNCDYSGLNDNEIELIKDFPDFNVIDWENTNFVRCAIHRLYDNCVEIELIGELVGAKCS